MEVFQITTLEASLQERAGLDQFSARISALRYVLQRNVCFWQQQCSLYMRFITSPMRHILAYMPGMNNKSNQLFGARRKHRLVYCSRYSDWATGRAPDESGFGSWLKQEIFLFSKAPRPSLGPSSLLIILSAGT